MTAPTVGRPETVPAISRVTPIVPGRRPLPVRPVTGPIAAARIAEVRANADAHQAGITVPPLAWQALPDGTAHARLDDGTALLHTGAVRFTALVPCPLGAHHTHPVRTPGDLEAARTTTDQCHTPHADLGGWPDVVHLGPAFRGRRQAEAALVRTLHDMPKEHTHHEA